MLTWRIQRKPRRRQRPRIIVPWRRRRRLEKLGGLQAHRPHGGYPREAGQSQRRTKRDMRVWIQILGRGLNHRTQGLRHRLGGDGTPGRRGNRTTGGRRLDAGGTMEDGRRTGRSTSPRRRLYELSVKRWAERTSYPNSQRPRGAGLPAGGHRIEHGTVCHKKTFGVLDEDRIVTSGGPSRRALLLEAVSGLATR